MRKLILASLLMLGATAQAQYVFREYNINGIGDSYPHSLIVMNGKLYFVATAGGEGTELFYTTGNHPNIGIVSDILPGTGSSNPENVTLLNNSKLVFSADDGTGKGIEVWQTDGTSTGTSLLKDIYVGGVSSTPTSFVAYNGKVYFSAFGSGGGFQDLWATDGTTAGTALFKDVNPTGGSNPVGYCEANGKLFFTATTDLEGAELWVTSGTDTSTKMVKDIQPGIMPSMPQNKISLGSKLLFQVLAPPPTGGVVYQTDGTLAGTTLFGKAGLNNLNDKFIIQYNGKYYFTGGVNSANELWESDGTLAGTKSIAVIGTSGYPVVYKNKLYFTATEPSSGTELWVSDGTNTGTKLLVDIASGFTGSAPSNLTVYKDKLYFSASINPNDTQLYVSDGTDTGTHAIGNPLGSNSNPLGGSIFKGFTEMNGVLYFAANYTGNGAELWSLEDTTKPVGVTGIEKINKVSLYPNPATETCHVSITSAGYTKGSIVVCDMTGRIVMQQQLAASQTSAALQLQNMPEGVYTVKLTLDDSVQNIKLIVR